MWYSSERTLRGGGTRAVAGSADPVHACSSIHGRPAQRIRVLQSWNLPVPTYTDPRRNRHRTSRRPRARESARGPSRGAQLAPAARAEGLACARSDTISILRVHRANGGRHRAAEAGSRRGGPRGAVAGLRPASRPGVAPRGLHAREIESAGHERGRAEERRPPRSVNARGSPQRTPAAVRRVARRRTTSSANPAWVSAPGSGRSPVHAGGAPTAITDPAQHRRRGSRGHAVDRRRSHGGWTTRGAPTHVRRRGGDLGREDRHRPKGRADEIGGLARV